MAAASEKPGETPGFRTALIDPNERYCENIIGCGLFDAFKKTAKRICDLGWAPDNAGNISIRESRRRGRFFITAAGSNFKELRPQDIVLVSGVEMYVGDESIRMGNNLGDCLAVAMHSLERQKMMGDVREHTGIKEITLENLPKALRFLNSTGMVRFLVNAVGHRKPSSEALLHAMIYAKRWGWLDEVNGILHCHKLADSSVSSTPTPFRDIGYGNIQLAVEAVLTLKKEDMVQLTDHGIITVTSEYHNEKDYGRVFNSAFDKTIKKCMK